MPRRSAWRFHPACRSRTRGMRSGHTCIMPFKSGMWEGLLFAAGCLLLLARGCHGRTEIVKNSTQFYTAVGDRAVDVIRLKNDVSIRNYYGWGAQLRHSGHTNALGKRKIAPMASRNLKTQGRPILDLDSKIFDQLFPGTTDLTLEGLHITGLEQDNVARIAMVNQNITVNNCVVEVLLLKAQRPGALFQEPQTPLGELVRFLNQILTAKGSSSRDLIAEVDDAWCHENFNTGCRTGGVYIKNATWHGADPWGGGDNAVGRIINSLVIMKPGTGLVVKVNGPLSNETQVQQVQQGISNMAEIIRIFFPFAMLKDACKLFGSPLATNTTIESFTGNLPPDVFIDFGRLNGCLEIEGSTVLRIKDLIIKNLVFKELGTFPDLFPFAVSDGSTILLENVIIEIDTREVNLEFLDRWVAYISSKTRPLGFLADAAPRRQQRVHRWRPQDCIAAQEESRECKERKKCSEEALCNLGAVFMEDVAFVSEDNKTRYHVLHSLFTIASLSVKPPALVFPSRPGIVPGRRSPLRDPSSSQNGSFANQNGATDDAPSGPQSTEPTSDGGDFLDTTVVGASVGVILALFIGLVLVWRKKQAISHLAEDLTVAKKSSDGAPVVPDQPIDEESDGNKSESLGSKDHRSYQHAAENLLGSVTLGHLLAMGSFGRVYKATWNGATVAVKVICGLGGNRTAGLFAQREATLSSHLRHPNIVHTFFQTARNAPSPDESDAEVTASSRTTHPSVSSGVHSTGDTSCRSSSARNSGKSSAQPAAKPPLQAGGYVQMNQVVQGPDYDWLNKEGSFVKRGDDDASEDIQEIWLVQEWCDMGSLEIAIKRGVFLLGNGEVNMKAAVDTCLDVARGMSYLQGRSVIHGDMKSSNILLTGSMHEAKGFTAKVADFGLSRELRLNASHIKTKTTGTLCYMPPELIQEEKLMPASDVYSYAIVMWEIVAGQLPLEGVPYPLALKRLLHDNWRPSFPEGANRRYVALAEDCWAAKPSERPSFGEIADRLGAIRKELSQRGREAPEEEVAQSGEDVGV